MHDGPGEARVPALHEVRGEAALQHQGDLLVVQPPRPRRRVPRDAGQHHQPVVAAPHHAAAALALRPPAPAAQPLLAAHLHQHSVTRDT